MMEVIEQLMFQGQSHKQKGHETKASESAPLLTRAQKLDRLCKALSTPENPWNWSIERVKDASAAQAKLNGNNTGVNIIFHKNKAPVFSWNFGPMHFSVSDLTKKENSWTEQVAAQWANLSHSHTNTLAPWFVGQRTFDGLAKSRGAHFENLIYAFPLASNDGKLEAFKKIVSAPKTQAQALRTAAEKIRSKLPEAADLYTRQQIHIALSNADFPYGMPPHLIGKPNIRYKRIPFEELSRLYGPNVAKKLGSSVQREIKDSETDEWKKSNALILGDNLLDEHGNEIKADWYKAMDLCLNLNPPEMRKRILKHFYELDEHGEPKVDSNEKPVFLKEPTQPTEGCFLPLKETWSQLSSDTGYPEKQYVAQIPHLYNRYPWSSSGYPNNPDYALVFYGSLGNVSNFSRYYGGDSCVRCCCASAEAWGLN